MLFRAKRELLVVLFLAACQWANAFTRTDSLFNMPDTSWRLISDFWPSASKLSGLTDYSGMVYNPHRHSIMLHGGGHATTGLTNIVEFSFQAMRWDSITPTVDCSRYDSATAVYFEGIPTGGIYNSANEPVASARHSYDELVIPHDSDLMIVAGAPWSQGSGGNYCTNWSSSYGKGGEWCGNAMWVFNRTTLKWSHTWSSNDGNWFAPMTNRMTTRPGGATAWNPKTGLIYGVSANALVSWDYKQETVQYLSSAKGEALSRSLNYYPGNQSLFLFETDNVYEWSFLSSSWTTKSPSGNENYPAAEELPQICLDTLNDVFFTVWNNAFVYYSPRTNTWYRIPYPANFPKEALFKNLIYDPVNQVAILLASPPAPYEIWEKVMTWAFKFSNVPGKFPGTRTAGGVGADGVFNSLSSMVVSVKPLPFNPKCEIEVKNLAFPESERLQKVSLEIFDIHGKKVHNWSFQKLNYDRTITVEWNGSNHPSGNYLLRVKVQGNKSYGRTIYKTLVLLK